MMKSGFSNEALFNGSWSKLSTHALEKGFLRNPHFICCFSFQTLRVGGVSFMNQTKILERWTVLSPRTTDEPQFGATPSFTRLCKNLLIL